MSTLAYEEFNSLHEKYEKEKVLHSEAEKYAAQVRPFFFNFWIITLSFEEEEKKSGRELKKVWSAN